MLLVTQNQTAQLGVVGLASFFGVCPDLVLIKVQSPSTHYEWFYYKK
ncbi:hypothetical protein VIBC2010_16804 [Vibrio caribbeanicus ATCC BAA-2122]|uniref:Uncharacterized protein n=1 Tax=Vibrio caribbeanicus ATCC BAA-2122 TaxID=796620 RepID=E3BQ22_9VIBR|nr:hypothetical protein VIBC2010_16804 [Vibrio caribbeanicus ATCC BAA-2122]